MVRDHSNDLNLLRVCTKVCPKDVLGRDEDGPSEDPLKNRLKDVIGRDEDGPSEDCPKVCPKDVIGQDEDGLSEDCPKVRPNDSDWTRRRCRLKIVQMILIGRDEDVV